MVGARPQALKVSLLGGFIQAVSLSALGLLAGLDFGVPYPPQEVFNEVTQLLGTPAMFQLVHATFGYGQGGKVAAFIAVAALWLGGLTALRLAGPLFGTALLFLGTALLIPMPGPVLYALAFLGLFFALQPITASPGRRGVMRVLGGGAAALLVGGSLPLLRGVLGSGQRQDRDAWTRTGGLQLGVTAQRDLYYVSKNIEPFDPDIDRAQWRLAVRGLVRTPTTFTFAELQAFPQVEFERTLYCISNPVGGPLLGNVVWTGFKVADLLRAVGVQTGARWIVWRSDDGYAESLPLGEALEEDVLLAHQANGEPLSRKHGYPLRVLIPDRLGMKQPKWITAIELTAEEVPGYWAERGWTRTGYLETSSRIDEPSAQNPVVAADTPTEIRGVAFAGTQTITRVEVSTDGGSTWQDAALSPKRSAYAWTLWSLGWTPTLGPQRLVVRAYANGELQTSQAREPLPEAATGWHSVEVVAA